MAVSMTNNTIRMRWELVPNDAPAELAVFTMYTGKRDSADYPAIAQEMEDFLTNISGTAGGVINGYTIASKLFVDEWQNPIFSSDHWGAAYSRNVTAAVADGGDTIPYQCSYVVSRLTTDTEVPTKRRFNRSYLGPISSQFVTSAGLMSSSGQTALGTKVQTFHTALQGVALEGGVPVQLKGLCNVTYKGVSLASGPQVTNTNTIRIGEVIDTQRRRRNALDEAYDLFPLTVPT